MQTQNVSSSSLETLTRARLAEIIHERIGESVGYTKSLSTQFVDAFFDEICNALIRNEAVKISSFGTFLVRHKNPRVGRNPK
ncbi:MAG: hypothetical protein HOK20_02375, partial [Alphaproteobacteria bacterium]|nr:hypothetical protein [Alphaproteobacteria bacterium]